MSKPIIVVIEGVDCVGKTTLAKSICNEPGWSYLYTPREPFSSIRKEIEGMKDLNARFFYYISCVVGVQQHIKSILDDGKNIVIDRYVYSTFVMHKTLGVDTECVDRNRMNIYHGDCKILLSASSDVRTQRMLQRNTGRTVDYSIEQRQDVLDMAQDEFRKMPLKEIKTDNLSMDEVYGRAIDIIKNYKGG